MKWGFNFSIILIYTHVTCSMIKYYICGVQRALCRDVHLHCIVFFLFNYLYAKCQGNEMTIPFIAELSRKNNIGG